MLHPPRQVCSLSNQQAPPPLIVRLIENLLRMMQTLGEKRIREVFKDIFTESEHQGMRKQEPKEIQKVIFVICSCCFTNTDESLIRKRQILVCLLSNRIYRTGHCTEYLANIYFLKTAFSKLLTFSQHLTFCLNKVSKKQDHQTIIFRPTDLFRSQIKEFNRSTNLDNTGMAWLSQVIGLLRSHSVLITRYQTTQQYMYI